MSYAPGEHRKAALDVADQDQARALHARLWEHRNQNHERMSPAELDDVEAALHELELGDDSGELAKHRRNWQRRQTRVGTQELKREEHERERKSPRTRAKRAGDRARRRAPTTARRALRRTGIPAAADTASGLVLQTLGVIVGLSVAYLLLTNAERRSAGASFIGKFAKGVTRGMQLLVSPVDPLNAVDRAAVAKGDAVRSTAERAAAAKRRASAKGQLPGLVPAPASLLPPLPNTSTPKRAPSGQRMGAALTN